METCLALLSFRDRQACALALIYVVTYLNAYLFLSKCLAFAAICGATSIPSLYRMMELLKSPLIPPTPRIHRRRPFSPYAGWDSGGTPTVGMDSVGWFG